jgi:hypothetical protein
MDYSASIQDDNHVEGDPWGSPNSSPRQNRTGFGASIASLTGDIPEASYQYPSQNSSNGLGDGGFGGSNEHEYRRPDTASTDSAGDSLPAESRSEEAVPAVQHYTENQGFGAGDQPPPLSPNPQQQPSQKPPGGQAHPREGQQQSQQPQPQQQQQARRPQAPQFRLQAKITGLERTGRKDPILRFDVYVRLLEKLGVSSLLY